MNVVIFYRDGVWWCRGDIVGWSPSRECLIRGITCEVALRDVTK